jgi:capsid assembly protease
MGKREPTRVMSLILDHPWAIQQPDLAQILDVIDRRVHEAVDLDAVAAHLGRPLLNTGGQVTLRDKVAVIDITGPIFRYANIFTMVSGATSIEDLGMNLQTALETSNVQDIVLNINSPGGQADGINEMADMIRAADTQKPITAYVGGTGASAAYWLASASRRIVINESAFVGSIGVVVAFEERSGSGKRYEFVSSQSPNKRPDPATEAGREQYQKMADKAAQLFIDRVAKFRNVSSDDVVSRFGGGATLMGNDAVTAGMADDLGSFEGLIAELNPKKQEVFSMAANNNTASTANPSPPTSTTGGVTVSAAPVTQADIDAGTRVAADRERARIASILSLPEAQGREALAQHLALNTQMDADAAKEILLMATKTNAVPAQPANPLAAAMANVANPKVGVGAENSDESVQAEAARILALVPSKHKVSRAS